MFKVGDRVKYVGDDMRVRGKIGTIYYDDETSNNQYDVIFENLNIGHDGKALDGSHNHWWCGEEGYNKIELLEKPQNFKVGDKIRLKKINPEYHIALSTDLIGKIGEITEIDDEDDELKYRVELDKFHKFWFAEEEIEEIGQCYCRNLFDEGEKNMNVSCYNILNIYEDRNIDNYKKEMQERNEKIRQEDEIYKIKEELLKQINTIYENNNIDYKAEFCLPTLPETGKKLEKSEKIYKEQCEKLDKVLKEVKAQLLIAPDYETAVKILKKYGVYNKDGKINA